MSFSIRYEAVYLVFVPWFSKTQWATHQCHSRVSGQFSSIFYDVDPVLSWSLYTVNTPIQLNDELLRLRINVAFIQQMC